MGRETMLPGLELQFIQPGVEAMVGPRNLLELLGVGTRFWYFPPNGAAEKARTFLNSAEGPRREW